MLRKIIGRCLIASSFVVIIAGSIAWHGLVSTLIVLWIASVMIAVVTIGLILVDHFVAHRFN